jgi:hypothetical protein
MAPLGAGMALVLPLAGKLTDRYGGGHRHYSGSPSRS